VVSTMTRCRETTESKVFEAERSTTATGRICCQRTNDDEAASRMLRGNYSTARACQKATCSCRPVVQYHRCHYDYRCPNGPPGPVRPGPGEARPVLGPAR
jgi:hypothetical protein